VNGVPAAEPGVGEQPEDESVAEDDAVFEAPALLRILWADPQHMPEHLALWSIKRFGPRAASRVEKLQASHPDAQAAELENRAIEHQTNVSMTEGALVGGPFILIGALMWWGGARLKRRPPP